MVFDSNRPPLPAPTEPSTLDSADDSHFRDDIHTNVSTRTDKTSFSIPADGTPITINTTNVRGALHKRYPSQTSLLIEYFEGAAKDSKLSSRPSVRVRVTPSSRKNKVRANDAIKLSHAVRHPRKPSFTRRISLASQRRHQGISGHTTENSEISVVSSAPPVDVEVLQSYSDFSSHAGRFIPMASDVSSMPADSMLGKEPQILAPRRRKSRSLERGADTESTAVEAQETLAAPKLQRSRSLSKDRITQRVMEKLQQQQADVTSPRSKDSSRSRDPKRLSDDLASPRKSHGRKHKDTEEMMSGTESSFLSSNADRRSGAAISNRSAVSGASSINNPKLLATVEDAIKRLILPELNALKEENRTSRNREKFETISRDTAGSTSSREPSRRRMSKSSSAPKLSVNKNKVLFDGEGDNPDIVVSRSSTRKGERRSSRGSVSDKSVGESSVRDDKSEKRHGRKSKDKEAPTSRTAAVAGAGLTAAALRHHTSREEKEEERKLRKHHASHGRSGSAAGSVEYLTPKKTRVPPFPFNHSELQSDITRDSILSADTETKERRSSTSTRSSRAETPLNDVPRGYITPSRTPLQQILRKTHGERSPGHVAETSKADRTHASRSKEVTQASLEAAAAAKARAIERSVPQESLFEIESETPNRGVSPIQSEASYQHHAMADQTPRLLRSYHSGNSISSLDRPIQRQPSDMSIPSLGSKPSTIAARTRKRPQGVNLESSHSVLGDPETPREAEEFFEQSHEENDALRRAFDGGLPDSPISHRRRINYTDDSEAHYLDRHDKGDIQDMGQVGLSPHYVHTPLAVESAVASLHDPSGPSVRSSAVSTPMRKGNRLSQVSPSPAVRNLDMDKSPSSERWGAIRDKAELLAAKARAEDSPRQSLAHSLEEPRMHHNALPTAHDHMMPEIGYGMDDGSDVTTNPSIIQGPHGGPHGGPHEYLDPDEAFPHSKEDDATPTSFSKGFVTTPNAAHHLRNETPRSSDDGHQATVEVDYGRDDQGEHQYEQSGYLPSIRTPQSGPSGWKDEGYQSANQREGYTPQNRNHPKWFDDDGLGEDYDDAEFGARLSAKQSRPDSLDSHGLASPLYDSATGKGLDRIQSKDVVALMDHLTVRDAQRNARDTEILVTLVRSAAEMRNQLDEMRQFIKTQDNMIMQNTDKRVAISEQRILGGPRPQPAASPRISRSQTEDVDTETKKKNVFKRALKGLSLKGDADIKNIEAMLVQLLGDVEGLKQIQQLSLDQTNRTNSLTSYENLRASGDPGYEPEGRANTASSLDQSGYISNAASSNRRIQDLHSGFDVVPTNRISTVQEVSDEEYEQEEHFDNTERMTTPTQEAYQNKRASQEAPLQTPRAVRDLQAQDNTPKRRHKSNSSSIFGIPKTSRWSKTTSSTNRESLPRGSYEEKRMYSDPSRSGSQVDEEDYADEYDEPYGMHEDDRLRSNVSLQRDERASIRSTRSPSPLVPEEHMDFEMEDPKYQAHRNSLNLQHPQPRAGQTGRHQNHLETQAHTYEQVRSPDFDQWGSMPALARNRLSAGQPQHAARPSPLSSDGGYSEHSAAGQQAPPRPPKVPEDVPLIPSSTQHTGTLAGYGQTRQMYSSSNEFGSQGALTPLAPIAEVRYSLETDRGHRGTPVQSPRPASQQYLSPQRKITGPRPMGSRSPSGDQGSSGSAAWQHADTAVRRMSIATDLESLESYRSSVVSETF